MAFPLYQRHTPGNSIKLRHEPNVVLKITHTGNECFVLESSKFSTDVAVVTINTRTNVVPTEMKLLFN